MNSGSVILYGIEKGPISLSLDNKSFTCATRFGIWLKGLGLVHAKAKFVEPSRHETKRIISWASPIFPTSLRPNEVAHLKRSDVSFARQCMNVRVKGGWIKKTALSYHTITILEAYLSTRTDGSEALFVTRRGVPVSACLLPRPVKEAGKPAGLPILLTCNRLRRTLATRAAETFGKVITNTLMGHRSLSTTEVYAHLDTRCFKAVMKLHPLANREERSRS